MNRAPAVWPDLDVAMTPFDPLVGPFPHAPFLRAWYAEMGIGRPFTLSAGGSTLPLVEVNGDVTGAGPSHLTDYHSPLGADPAALAAGLGAVRREHRSLNLDSLPAESAERLAKGLTQAGIEYRSVDDDPTLVLKLESADYLGRLSKKQRHEARRKRRRFVETLGEPELVWSASHSDLLPRFVAMHRLTPGEKGSFMTSEVQSFFERLYEQPGWEVVGLSAGGEVVAAFFGYREPGAFYLYNSAFQPEHREVSPGVVALVQLIEHFAARGHMTFDFLKGDEDYKLRLGASPRPLYRIELS